MSFAAIVNVVNIVRGMDVTEAALQSLKKVKQIGKSLDAHGEDCARLGTWLQLMKVKKMTFYAFG